MLAIHESFLVQARRGCAAPCVRTSVGRSPLSVSRLAGSVPVGVARLVSACHVPAVPAHRVISRLLSIYVVCVAIRFISLI